MTGDPLVREIGRITDDQGRVLIIAADHATVTLRTLHTRTNGAVTLSRADQEELALMLTAAVSHAGWQRHQIDTDTGTLAAEAGAM